MVVSSASPTPPDLGTLLGEGRWVRALARSLVGNAHDADDLAQEAYLVALDRPPGFGVNLRAWLGTVMQNLLRQGARAARRRQRREAIVEAERPRTAAPADELVERARCHRAVVDAVLALAAPFREVVLLRYFEDLPPRAIAVRLQIPVATVHSRLLRAQARLRDGLDHDPQCRGRWQAALLPLPLSLPVVVTPLGILAMNMKALSVAAALIVGSAVFWLGRGDDATTAAQPGPATPPVVDARTDRGRGGQPTPGNGASRIEAAPATGQDPAAPSLRRQIHGRLVDADGRPAPGLRVRVGDLAATSDSQGAFQVASAAVDAAAARIDEPAWLTILEGVVGPGVAPSPVLVVAAPTLALGGHVRSEHRGQALVATLRVVWPADLRSRLHDIADSAFEPSVVTTSAADGAFSLIAAAVRGAELLVTADGHRPQRRPLPPVADGAMAIVLEPLAGKPGTLQGQVVDPQGRAVRGAVVGLGVALARSDELGNFTIEDDGEASALAASAAGHRRGTLARGAGFPPFVLLPLGPSPLSIQGRVVDAEGRGLGGIVVWASDPTVLCTSREPIAVEGIASGHGTAGELRQRFERGEFDGKDPQQVMREVPTALWPWVRTDASGAFELGGLEERAYSLRALDNDTLLTARLTGVPAGSRDVRLQLDASQLFAEVRGVVVAAGGAPVAGARILVQIDTQRLSGTTMHERAVATAVSDDQGRFALPRVPRADAYFRIDGEDILPSEPGRGLAGGLFELSGGRPLELRLEVRRRMHVQVELLDPSRADAIAVLDGDGRNVMLTEFRGRGRSDTEELALTGGRSSVFVVPDTAATLVLRKAGQDLVRTPLQLRAGGVNTVRL